MKDFDDYQRGLLVGATVGAASIPFFLTILILIDKPVVDMTLFLLLFVAYGLGALIMIRKFPRKKTDEKTEPKAS